MAANGGFCEGIMVGETMGAPNIGNNTPEAVAAGKKMFASVKLAIHRWNRGRLYTVWIECIFIGRRASIIERFCSPGTRIFVKGRLEQSKWVSKQGVQHLDYRLIVDDFQFLDRKNMPREATIAAQDASADDNRKSTRNPRYQGAIR